MPLTHLMENALRAVWLRPCLGAAVWTPRTNDEDQSSMDDPTTAPGAGAPDEREMPSPREQASGADDLTDQGTLDAQVVGVEEPTHPLAPLVPLAPLSPVADDDYTLESGAEDGLTSAASQPDDAWREEPTEPATAPQGDLWNEAPTELGEPVESSEPGELDDAFEAPTLPAVYVPVLTPDLTPVFTPVFTPDLRTAQASPLARALERDRRTKKVGKRRRGLWIALISLALLLILATPVALAAVSAARDYTTLKALGEDGLAHLLAVKGDLTGNAGSSLGGGGSSSALRLPTLSSLANGTGTTATLLAAVQSLLATPGPNVTDPAYTYLAQRQSGTFNPLTVTVHPAKGVTADGTTTDTFKGTIATNTYFAVGGQPIATPTPTAGTPTATPTKATATPSATASPGASGASSGHVSSLFPDPARIAAATSDLRAAQSDFQSLGDRLAHPDQFIALAAMVSSVDSELHAAQILAGVGVDLSQAGLAMLGAATPLLTRLHGASSLLSGSQKLITSADISALQTAMALAATRLSDASKRLASVNVAKLPLSAHQKALFTEVEPLLPQINALLPQASGMIGLAGWLLGVDAPRNFLVQTLDRGEMRATGGFTGQYGVLTLNDGKLEPFSLQDVNCLDYLESCLANGWTYGRVAPAPYNTWWPFANWGLRDSSLNADFPTDARMVMDTYYHESGQHVDGLIDVSPIAIEDVLRITGPIQVPLYGETITANNLEQKLHYYQQDPAAIAKENQLSKGDSSTSTRKRFTQLVGQILQDRIKALPVSELAKVAEQMLLDMRSKDLEVYFTNPQAEAWLTQLHIDGSINTTAGDDGYLLVQENVSVSKATSFVQMTQSDDVTLDNSGGATHTLTLTFSANYTYDQVYGLSTYHDYLRIYTPPQSKLLWGDGFDSGQPLCWGPFQNPTQTPPPKEPPQLTGVPTCTGTPYAADELSCPDGGYAPEPLISSEFGSADNTPDTLDQLSGPTNTTSDTPNRAMFGGYVLVPDYCTATVRVSWYTPNVAAK